MRAPSRCFLIGLALVFTLSIVGCGGGSSGTDEGGTGGGVTSSLVAQSFDEQCAFCHGTGKSQDVAVVHSIATNSPLVTITAVSEVGAAGSEKLQLSFKIVDSANPLIPLSIPRADIRFALAKLVTGAGGDQNWQSYINTTQTKAAGDPGTGPNATVTQATTHRGSQAGAVFVDNLNGTYSYTFSFNMNTVTDPVSGAAIPYDKAATHRIAMQVPANVDNAFVDFVPQALPALGTGPARKISVNASCNQCHIRLGLHGGDRKAVEYCVTCHNPGSTDPHSGETVDFKVMIHKIHRGEELPAVQAGGEYAIWGNANSKNDYSTVVLPQDIRNCVKCHSNTPINPATPQGDNWKNVPTASSCTSCHNDPGTAPGFPALTAQQITDAHVIPEQVAAAKFRYNIISITNTAPGQFPAIKFSVTDPTNGNAAYNILTAPEFRAGSASTLNVLIAWDTKDYTNTGSLRTPAQPISINALSGAVDNFLLDGSFTVASTVPIPAGVTSGAVAIEGHPAVQSVPGGAYDVRVPVTGVVQSFPAGTPPRRTVVDFDTRCKQCHEVLSLHGANRNNNIQLCVICHNANASDITRRPVSGVGTDGKTEEAIDFKYMIHSIHAAKAGTDVHGFRTNGIVVYGFGGSVNDFSHVRMPSGSGSDNLNIRNCLGCHIDPPGATPPTNALPSANALPTTIKTGSDRADPNDDTNITPIASVCSSCHDDITSKTHMTSNGAVFDFKAFTTVVSGGGGSGGGTDQAALCGPGPASSQPAGHTARTDCCSCHSPR